MVMEQNTSSRTLASIISEWHNDDGIEHKFKDICIWNRQNTTVTGLIYMFQDIWIFNQQFSLQCLCYTILHTSTAREAGIASPQTTKEAPAGSYFTQSPTATEVETTSLPWPEEEAPTGFPRGLHAVQQQSHQQSASQRRPPQLPGRKTKCRWNLYRYEHSIKWTFCMNILVMIEM